MIPNFITVAGSSWQLLPPGIHDATLEEVRERFAINSRRHFLFQGLLDGLKVLFRAGCKQAFLDGSYVTEKPLPNDYEVCWDVTGIVDPALLDPVFFDFTNGRLNQKLKYGGEYFPASVTESDSGLPFLEFFQIDKETGNRKGIIRITN